MQASQALQVLLEAADNRLVDIRYQHGSAQAGLAQAVKSGTCDLQAYEDQVKGLADQLERTELATAICTAMLNTALVVARYRAFVELDTEQPTRTKAEQKKAIKAEHTICGPSMEAIISGLRGLEDIPHNVRVMVFEQMADRAEVITAYQGNTKTGQFRLFLGRLPDYETKPTFQ